MERKLNLLAIKLLLFTLVIGLTACGGGNKNQSNASSNIEDIIAPSITLNGNSIVQNLLEETYIELGATATDDKDGSVNVIISGNVDNTTLGEYVITYSASDSSGNTSNIERTVIVTDVWIITQPFITTWKTDNIPLIPLNTSNENQIKITTKGSGYDYNVDWGDGSIDNNIQGDITHTYSTKGIYTVSITGKFPQLYFGESSHRDDSEKLLTIEQWGDNKWYSMEEAFAGTRELISNASDIPDLSKVTNMKKMFIGSSFNQDLNSWDVSNVTIMTEMFAASSFSQDLSGWDTSNVKSMDWMFSGNSNFNQDLSNWDVSNVVNMQGMFAWTNAFNQDLSHWDVSNVIDMSYMFWSSNFNQNINSWNVSNVSDMHKMFDSSAFNQDLSSWNVSNVIDMSYMFYGSPFNLNISSWDVSKVTNMGVMFAESSFNKDINNWNVSNVAYMGVMFANSSFNQNISSWDVSNVIGMNDMFQGVTLSTEKYDALLMSWSNLSLQNNVDFDAGKSKYSNAALSARDILTNYFQWTINDAGIDN